MTGTDKGPGSATGASAFVIDPPLTPAVPVDGGGLFPVRRIFCVGMNYADHVREMGRDPENQRPIFFTKPADAAVSPSDGAALAIPFPPQTEDLHYEAEFVLALGRGGADLTPLDAEAAIAGVALGCDLTRRDLQFAAKKAGTPWDMAKGFDRSAVVGAIRLGAGLTPASDISLHLNGTPRQAGTAAQMVYGPGALLAELSRFVTLRPGDLIFTGTPDGVGPLAPGDRVTISGSSLPPLEFSLT